MKLLCYMLSCCCFRDLIKIFFSGPFVCPRRERAAACGRHRHQRTNVSTGGGCWHRCRHSRPSRGILHCVRQKVYYLNLFIHFQRSLMIGFKVDNVSNKCIYWQYENNATFSKENPCPQQGMVSLYNFWWTSKVSAEELGIRVVFILCTRLLSIQTTKLKQPIWEDVWMHCDWIIQDSPSGLELKISPPFTSASRRPLLQHNTATMNL